jgi:hypothetical protein
VRLLDMIVCFQVMDEVTHVFTYLNDRDVEFWKVLDELKQIGGACLVFLVAQSHVTIKSYGLCG